MHAHMFQAVSLFQEGSPGALEQIYVPQGQGGKLPLSKRQSVLISNNAASMRESCFEWWAQICYEVPPVEWVVWEKAQLNLGHLHEKSTVAWSVNGNRQEAAAVDELCARVEIRKYLCNLTGKEKRTEAQIASILADKHSTVWWALRCIRQDGEYNGSDALLLAFVNIPACCSGCGVAQLNVLPGESFAAQVAVSGCVVVRVTAPPGATADVAVACLLVMAEHVECVLFEKQQQVCMAMGLCNVLRELEAVKVGKASDSLRFLSASIPKVSSTALGAATAQLALEAEQSRLFHSRDALRFVAEESLCRLHSLLYRECGDGSYSNLHVLAAQARNALARVTELSLLCTEDIASYATASRAVLTQAGKLQLTYLGTSGWKHARLKMLWHVDHSNAMALEQLRGEHDAQEYFLAMPPLCDEVIGAKWYRPAGKGVSSLAMTAWQVPGTTAGAAIHSGSYNSSSSTSVTGKATASGAGPGVSRRAEPGSKEADTPFPEADKRALAAFCVSSQNSSVSRVLTAGLTGCVSLHATQVPHNARALFPNICAPITAVVTGGNTAAICHTLSATLDPAKSLSSLWVSTALPLLLRQEVACALIRSSQYRGICIAGPTLAVWNHLYTLGIRQNRLTLKLVPGKLTLPLFTSLPATCVPIAITATSLLSKTIVGMIVRPEICKTPKEAEKEVKSWAGAKGFQQSFYFSTAAESSVAAIILVTVVSKATIRSPAEWHVVALSRALDLLGSNLRLGARLLAHIATRAQSANATISLHVLPTATHALKLYQEFGFRVSAMDCNIELTSTQDVGGALPNERLFREF